MDRVDYDRAWAFAVFSQQDSGCVSYGIEVAGRRLFVKTATTPAAHESLGRAILFHHSVRHPVIVAPIDVVDTPDRRQLIYPWHDGVVLNHATVNGSDRSGLDRFHHQHSSDILGAIDAILDAHETVAAAGFVSVDLYDGCFLYDFDCRTMRLIDLDEYRPGPFIVEGDRLPGSTRYMAPEELVHGATIDDRTTVFHLGRTASQLLGERNLSGAQREVVGAATRTDPVTRHRSVAAMAAAWRSVASA
jgi:serine/threonine-protein kinase